jgi:adenine-specific DNA-methyltransferase
MQNLLEDLKNLLEKDERFTADGELLKNKIVESALKLDEDLITLLLSHDKLKEHFFTKVGKATVFDKDEFVKFVSNKEFLPDSYTAFKNKIGLTEDGEYTSEKKDVVLSWPYKDCVLEGGQTKEDAKRDEVFWNQTLAPDEIDRLLDPKVFTNAKRVDKDGEQDFDKFNRREDGTISDNLIVKGNNLLALHSLKKEFAGKVKLIYIDPPYNTSGDNNIFTYNNRFNHSSWLTFIKNRLEVAKILLKDDGILAITIDDYEQGYLKVLADEVFGLENYLGTVIIQNNPRGRTINSNFATCHEYSLFYGKNSEYAKIGDFDLTPKQAKAFNLEDEKGQYRLLPFRRSGGYSTPEERPNSYYPIFYDEENNDFFVREKKGLIKINPIDTSGKKRVWRQTKPSFMEAVERGDIVCKKNNGTHTIYMKDRIKSGRKPKTIWTKSKYDASAHGTLLLKKLFEGEKPFSYPKSIYAVKDTIKICTDKNKSDIVLDFFAGSGTTGHATLELNKEDGGNRQFILVEQLLEHVEVCNKRIQKVLKKEDIDDSFLRLELAKWNQEFVEKVEKAKSKKELEKIWKKMQKRAFLSWRLDVSKFEENSKEFGDLSLENQKKFLLETLDQNQLYINYSEIEDEMYGVGEEDKKLNKEFYEK